MHSERLPVHIIVLAFLGILLAIGGGPVGFAVLIMIAVPWLVLGAVHRAAHPHRPN